MRTMFLSLVALALSSLTACKAEVEVKASADAEDDPAPKWEDASTDPDAAPRGSRFARAVEVTTAPDAAGPATATYPGFRTYDDGSCRVFLEVTGSSQVEMLRTPRGFRYRFLDVRVPERVNQLPMPTNQFDTVVSKVVVNRDGDDAVLVIETAYAVEPKHYLKRKGGGTVLSVDFPRKPLPDEQLAPLPPPSDEPVRLEADESEQRTLVQAPTLPTTTAPPPPPPAPSER